MIKKSRFKKQRLVDINILLSCLFFLGLSLGLVAQRGLSNVTTHKIMSREDFFKYIHHWIFSHGVDKIAQAIHRFVPDKRDVVLQEIIEHQEWPLTRNDKLKLILSLAELYPNDQGIQHQILNYIFTYADLFSQGEPLLYVMAYKGSYEEDIPLLLQWIKGVRKRTEQPFLGEAVRRALLYSVEQNDLETFEHMVAHGVPVSSSLATTLLWEVVENQKDPAFLEPLIKLNAQIDKPKRGYTPLMRAVLGRDFPMVEQLLKLEAQPNLVVDNEIGSALQIVLSKTFESYQAGRKEEIQEYQVIEKRLRDFGARE